MVMSLCYSTVMPAKYSLISLPLNNIPNGQEFIIDFLARIFFNGFVQMTSFKCCYRAVP